MKTTKKEPVRLWRARLMQAEKLRLQAIAHCPWRQRALAISWVERVLR